MPESPRLLRAATRPLHLGVLGAGTSVGTALAVLGGPPAAAAGIAVLVVSGAAWCALTAIDLVTQKGKPPPAPPAAEPPADDLAAARALRAGIASEDLRALFDAVLASAEQLRASMEAAGPLLHTHLLEAWAQAMALVEEAGRMAQRGNALHTYLAQEHPTALANEIAVLQARAARAKNREAGEGWRRAADARRRQVEARRQIEGLAERIRAELAALDGSLDEIHARVVHLSASDPAEAAVVGEDLTSRLKALNTSLTVLEQAVARTLEGALP